MRKTTFLPFLLAAVTAHAEPRLSSWLTDSSGNYARVYPTTTEEATGPSAAVTTWDHPTGTDQLTPTYAGIHEVSYTPTDVYIRSTGLASYIMGPWYLNAAKTNLFPNYPNNLSILYRIPLTLGAPPSAANKDQTGLGRIGLFVDGVSMFDSRDAFSYDTSAGQDDRPNAGAGVDGDDVWNRDAYVNESVTFDAGNAHQAGATYHYHANPPGLRHALGDSVDYADTTNTYTENFNGNHSPILGWMEDGYPLYGPYGYDDPNNAGSTVRRMMSGYQKRTITTRTTLPAWASRVQGYTSVGDTSEHTLVASLYGPAVTAGAGSQYELGHYIEDYEYLGDLGFTHGADFDLDEYNGRFCVTPDYPGGTYAYFSVIDATGIPMYPYNVGREYYGKAGAADEAASVPAGATAHFEGGPEASLSTDSLEMDIPSGDVTVKWNSVEGGKYTVYRGDNLTNWSPVASDFLAGGNLSSTTDTGVALTESRQFYKVDLNAIVPFDDAGYDYDDSIIEGNGPTPDFVANFPTAPPLPPQNAITSITVGGVTATIISYNQSTGEVELQFDDSSLAPGFYNATLNFSPGGTPTQVISSNQYEVLAAGENNILLIIVDDWAIDSSPIDNDVTQNPGTTFPTMANLQALAAGGVRFTNGYSQPVCSPMRATIMTGRQAFRTGVGSPGDPLLAAETTLPEAFTAASSPYQLASYGKWHLGGGNTGYSTLGGWPEFRGITGGGVGDYYSWNKNINGVVANTTTYTTTDQVNEAKLFIDAKETADEPWFVWMGFNAPHTPFHEPPAGLLQGGTGTSNRALYEKALEALDTEIGRLLQSVDFATTNVFLVGDNGTPGQVVQAPYGPTGGAGHSKGDLYEGGIHVPFVARGPDVNLPAGTSDEFVHVIDLFPTILEIAGVPDPGTGVDGTSLVPIFNSTDTADRCIITEAFNGAVAGRSIRLDTYPDYKLIIFGDPISTSDTPTYEFYYLPTDENENSPLNIGTLAGTALDAYNACIAKDAALGGGFSDPPVPVGDTVYLQLPNITGPASPPNNANVLPTLITMNDGSSTNQTATFVARNSWGTDLSDEADDVYDRYWVKCTLPAGVSGTYSNAVVTFPNNTNNGNNFPRVFIANPIVVKP